uniref:Uncharacterized protein n=1 Tax=Romanomermis culicivorax TaxID=13658 RepID=A0A915KFM0_ROMCU
TPAPSRNVDLVDSEDHSNYDQLIYSQIEKNAKFQIGMKLEAIDVYNVFNSITAATVRRLFRNGQMEIVYDGSPSDGIIVDDRSDYIFPVAYCQSQNIQMSKPDNFAKKTAFNWSDYFKQTNSEGASFVYFKK